MKCNETQGKWCKNKHGASKIIDTFETYHPAALEDNGEVVPAVLDGDGVLDGLQEIATSRNGSGKRESYRMIRRSRRCRL
jgi:hypothetical protein